MFGCFRLFFLTPLFILQTFHESKGLGGTLLPEELITVKSCGSRVRAQSLSVNPLKNIPVEQSRLFSGVLVEDGKGIPHFFITRALIGGHEALLEVTGERLGPVRTLWLGELQFTRKANLQGQIEIKCAAANEISGEWAVWLEYQRAGLQSPLLNGRRPMLSLGSAHENSVQHLQNFLLSVRKDLWASDAKFERYRPENKAPHLLVEQNHLSELLEAERIRLGSTPALGSVNHDVRNPLGNIVQAVTLAVMFHARTDYQGAQLETLFPMIERAEPVASSYLDIMQNQYRDDKLLRMARSTLKQLASFPRHSRLSLEQLNRLSNLKEVIEFVLQKDTLAVTEVSVPSEP